MVLPQTPPPGHRKSKWKGEIPMPRLLTTLLVTAVLAVGLAVVPTLEAQDTQAPSRSKTGHGMMGGRGMMGGMNRGQMSQMMDHCNQMMGRSHGSGRPNEQWRQQTPKTPEKKG
jgi:hypothetical protein